MINSVYIQHALGAGVDEAVETVHALAVLAVVPSHLAYPGVNGRFFYPSDVSDKTYNLAPIAFIYFV